MSRWRDPGAAIWPPMLKRPPPTDTAPDHSRSAAFTSSVERGRRWSETDIGLSCETSLTTRDPDAASASELQADHPEAAMISRNLRRLRAVLIGMHLPGARVNDRHGNS